MADKQEVVVSKKERAAAPVHRHPAFMRPFDEVEQWFESRFPRDWFGPLRMEWPTFRRARALAEQTMPAVDVIDREDDVIVRAEVPGVRKEDLKVSLSDGAITLEGRTEHAEEEKRADYYYHEISYGDFKRTVQLPADADTSKVNAKMKDGVLEIQIPKIERAKRHEVHVEIQ